MSNDQWDDQFNQDSFDQYEQPQERSQRPPKQGMSTAVKVILILFAVFGGGALLCCGGFVYFAYRMMPTVTERPEEVIAAQKELADITLLPELKPKMAATMDNFFVDGKLIMFASDDAKSNLMLFKIKLKVGNDPNQEAQIREAMQKESGSDNRRLDSEKTETRKITVKGVEEEFSFISGEDPKTKRKVRRITGTFQGKTGDVHLLYQTDEESYKEEDAVKMIESVK